MLNIKKNNCIMKVRVLILAMMVAFTSFANAQEQQVEAQAQQPEVSKIEVAVKRMAKKLMLKDSKQAKFMSLYKEYLEERAACCPDFAVGEDLTDAQLKSNMKKMLDVRGKNLKLDKKYYKKFARLLNEKQLDAIFGFKAQFCNDAKMIPAPKCEEKCCEAEECEAEECEVCE
jgi:hypothetical protein